MPGYVKLLLRLVICAWVVGIGVAQVRAQDSPPSTQPYAVMDRTSVSYQGPGRGTSSDIHSDTIAIGIVLPLQGKGAAHGKLLQQAAEIALDEENSRGPSADGLRFSLAVRNESEQWGQASNAIVQLITQDEAVAVIASADGRIAHQAEQIANKLGEPILTLSSDPTTTRINIPWIFRVGPSDAEQARVIAEEIYGSANARKVLLIAESDHDGRIGADEFVKAATSRGLPPPERVDVDSASVVVGDLVPDIESKKSGAIVVWSGPELSLNLLAALGPGEPTTPIYLCQKAAGFLPVNGIPGRKIRFVGPVNPPTAEAELFVARFRQATGEEPGIASQQIYGSVRTVISAVRQVGPNRARLRDYLANGRAGDSLAGTITFDPAGNSRQELTLLSLPPDPTKKTALASR
jgi:branched-chain amino acid transport system substrate-binding protein